MTWWIPNRLERGRTHGVTVGLTLLGTAVLATGVATAAAVSSQ